MKIKLPGIILCAVIAAAAFFISGVIPFGAVTISIILGMITGNIFKPGAIFRNGIAFSEKHLLTAAIALMGANLDYSVLKELGAASVVVIVMSVAFTIGAALLIGRLTGLDRNLCLLIGCGNAICGSSAIAAVQGVIKTDDEKVGISVAVINFFGTAGIFLIPLLATALFRTDTVRNGALIGTTLQAVGQVTAAGFSINDLTGQTATIVKMCRILMITPVVLVLSLIKRDEQKKNGSSAGIQIPPYIITFVLLSVAGSFGIIPAVIMPYLKDAGEALLITAMAGVGMKIRFENLLSGGRTAILPGLGIWGLQIIFDSVLIGVLL